MNGNVRSLDARTAYPQKMVRLMQIGEMRCMVVSKDEYREQIQLVKGLGPDTTVEFAPV